MRLNDQELQRISKNEAARKELAKKSLGWFAHLYFPHYISAATPDFHWRIYDDLSNEEDEFVILFAFRGSAKSTMASLFLPIWAALTERRSFIILISDTNDQAKAHIANIINELEDNAALIADFGPFESNDEWTRTNIVLTNGSRIMSRSRGQKVRGLRHRENRPDLIIADDVENSELVRTREQRDKTDEWFSSEVMPAIDTDRGKTILIGNLLHRDSLISRKKQEVEDSGMGVIREYPLIVNGKSVWIEKYDQATIEKIKVRSKRYYQREYLLQAVAEEDQIIKSVEWYTKLPTKTDKDDREVPAIKRIALAADLAISEKQTADRTAFNALAEAEDGNFYNLISEAGRWDFHDTLKKIALAYRYLREEYDENIPIEVGIEDVQYQRVAIQQIKREFGVPARGIPQTKDKRSRLWVLEPHFVAGRMRFRERADQEVVDELLGFGIEEHDDRSDAFEMSARMLLENSRPNIRVL